MTTNKDTDLREAVRRRYVNMPPLPVGFTDRLMERMDTKSAVSRRQHWWCWMSAAAAACLLIAIGIGGNHEFHSSTRSVVQSAVTDGDIKSPQVDNHVHMNEQMNAYDEMTECTRPGNPIPPTEQQNTPDRAAHTQSVNRAQLTEIPDTLGSGIWRSERNVAIALQMLNDCETTILREEQEMRNHIIQATFKATPQPANAVLVTNESGDYEVIETKTIIEI